jgi:hypothetical protein
VLPVVGGTVNLLLSEVACPIHASEAEVCPVQMGAAKECPVQVGTTEGCPLQVGTTEISLP